MTKFTNEKKLIKTKICDKVLCNQIVGKGGSVIGGRFGYFVWGRKGGVLMSVGGGEVFIKGGGFNLGDVNK